MRPTQEIKCAWTYLHYPQQCSSTVLAVYEYGCSPFHKEIAVTAALLSNRWREVEPGLWCCPAHDVVER